MFLPNLYRVYRFIAVKLKIEIFNIIKYTEHEI